MLRSQRRGRDPPCWLSEKEPLVGKRRVNFQRWWLPVSRIGLHRRGVERVNCGPKLLDLGEKGVYSSYTFKSFRHFDNSTEIEIDYTAILAMDLPNGLKKGQELTLSGKSVFEFENNKVIKLTDIS
ncbi:hypothetical protein [Denitrificimonas caeni]|uniref:Uncharacterized protein n=1 Tax=Denitrificimonas caeni TaxID=521720 RepID=A0AAE9VPX6_9GAMM|nr:hypothetical protein [Denitrificimonas caeni]WBE26091.1 hypothetical protein O6P33_04450 [Denitrificimonas caeni]